MKRWLCCVLMANSPMAYALDDTLLNRQQQAERYLTVNPPQEMFQSIADRTALSLSAEARKPYTEMLTKHLDMQTVSDTMKASMVTHFTAEELSALADFYSNPVAKSAMDKMGDYMGDVIPVVQNEMFKAQIKAFGRSVIAEAPEQAEKQASPEDKTTTTTTK